MRIGARPGALFLGAGAAFAALCAALPALADGHPKPVLLVAAVAGAAGLLLVGLLWALVSRLFLVPAKRLAAEAGMVAAAVGREVAMDAGGYGALAEVAETLANLGSRLAAVRGEQDRVVAEATRRADEQSARLAALLQDLHEGVLVCNLRHQILLYNQRARTLLAGSYKGGADAGSDLGLGRSLLNLVTREPVLHTLDRLVRRVADGRHRDHADGTTAGFVVATADGRLIQGRMAAIVGAEDAVTGYVVTLEDATGELASLARRDALLKAATEEVRAPLANLSAAAETIGAHPDLTPEERAAFDAVVIDAARTLNATLDRITAEYRAGIAAAWPMGDINSGNLFALVAERCRLTGGPKVVPTGLPVWLHGDSHSLVLALAHLATRVAQDAAAEGLSLDLSAEADAQGRFVYADLTWTGAPLSPARLDAWRTDPLADAIAGLTLGAILEHHRSDLWCERRPDGGARLRVPLPPARQVHGRSDDPTAPRPEFFDFDLLHQPLPEGALAKMPLRALSYVVFDCETTGLQPSQGDEIVSIAGVRIVNGRILTGESWQSLVNPGRPIPAVSTGIHGITDAMVADAPGPDAMLPQFRTFVGDAVLVAHNAAFDLKFLKMRQRAAGVRFDMPVLDTMILSRQLQGEDGEHSLDGIAARFGLRIADRHSALGDSLLTAAVFLRMLDMLEERGITTLDEAVRRSNMAVELQARERVF